MIPADMFHRGLLAGIIAGAFGTVVVLLVVSEIRFSLRERRARRAREDARSLCALSDRVRILRAECRDPPTEYARADPEEETRPMEILLEEGPGVESPAPTDPTRQRKGSEK
jgi:hypothetical protein